MTLDCPPLMTAQQVAEKLGVSDKFVYSLAYTNELPSFKLGGMRRFQWSDVTTWMERKYQAA